MNKVISNASWIILCRIIQSLLALFINIFTARYLGPSNFGIITYAASLVAFVMPISLLGYENVLVKELIDAPENEGAIIGTTTFLSLVSSLFCIISITLLSLALNKDSKITTIVCLLYSFVLLFYAFDLVRFWFQSKYLAKYTSTISLFAYLIVSGYKIYLLVYQKNVIWFAISNSFDYAIITLLSLFFYYKKGGKRLSISLKIGKDIFSRSKHYIISSMMVTVFAQTDKIMINSMIDESATGYYGAAVASAGFSTFFFVAVLDSLRPYVLEGKNIDNNTFEKRMTLLYSIIIYCSLAQSVLTAFFSNQIIKYLYGDAYTPAISALQIVVWYSTFSYLGAARNIWILANNQQHYLWLINMSGAIANVILNLLLIPSFGICGAAFASLITQFFTNVIIGYIIKALIPNNKIMLKSLNPVILLNAFSSFHFCKFSLRVQRGPRGPSD